MSTFETVLVLIDQLSAQEQHRIKTYLEQREQLATSESPAQVLTDFKIAWQEMNARDVLSLDELRLYLDTDDD